MLFFTFHDRLWNDSYFWLILFDFFHWYVDWLLLVVFSAFAPIFSARLRDIPKLKSGPTAVFECRVVGQPQPEVRIQLLHRVSEYQK